MALVVLGADDVETVLSKITHDTLPALMSTVFVRLSTNDGVAMPQRAVISSADGSHNTLFMPSSLAGLGTSIKTVSVPKSGVKGSTTASTLLLDEKTGVAKALINAESLTALRTASGCLLATKLFLSITPRVLVVFGAGAQIEAQIRLLVCSYETIAHCTIVNRTQNDRLVQLLERVVSAFPRMNFDTVTLDQRSSTLESVVSSADIICTATPSRTPLFDGKWVKAGAHINLVGSYTPEMVEIDDHLIRRCSKVVVDSRAACMSEAGELIKANIDIEGLLEIGDYLKEGDRTRETLRRQLRAGEVTIFKSVGVGLQDTAIAALVYERAQEMGIGRRIDSFQ